MGHDEKVCMNWHFFHTPDSLVSLHFPFESWEKFRGGWHPNINLDTLLKTIKSLVTSRAWIFYPKPTVSQWSWEDCRSFFLPNTTSCSITPCHKNNMVYTPTGQPLVKHRASISATSYNPSNPHCDPSNRDESSRSSIPIIFWGTCA